jgi:hypothetical protein
MPLMNETGLPAIMDQTAEAPKEVAGRYFSITTAKRSCVVGCTVRLVF